MPVSLRLVGLSLAIIIWILAFEANLGKGLACVVAPGDLTVVGTSNTATTGATNADTAQPL